MSLLEILNGGLVCFIGVDSSTEVKFKVNGKNTFKKFVARVSGVRKGRERERKNAKRGRIPSSCSVHFCPKSLSPFPQEIPKSLSLFSSRLRCSLFGSAAKISCVLTIPPAQLRRLYERTNMEEIPGSETHMLN